MATKITLRRKNKNSWGNLWSGWRLWVPVKSKGWIYFPPKHRSTLRRYSSHRHTILHPRRVSCGLIQLFSAAERLVVVWPTFTVTYPLKLRRFGERASWWAGEGAGGLSVVCQALEGESRGEKAQRQREVLTTEGKQRAATWKSLQCLGNTVSSSCFRACLSSTPSGQRRRRYFKAPGSLRLMVGCEGTCLW